MEQEFWAFGVACDKRNCSHFVLPPSEVTLTATITGITKRWYAYNYPSRDFYGFRDFRCSVAVAGTVIGSPIIDAAIDVDASTFFSPSTYYPLDRPEYANVYPAVAWREPHGGDWYDVLKFTYAAAPPFADVRCVNGALRLRQSYLLTLFNIGPLPSVGLPLTGASRGEEDENGESSFALTLGPVSGSFGAGARPTHDDPSYETFCNGVDYV